MYKFHILLFLNLKKNKFYINNLNFITNRIFEFYSRYF